jgi:hypothetical protein
VLYKNISCFDVPHYFAVERTDWNFEERIVGGSVICVLPSVIVINH